MTDAGTLWSQSITALAPEIRAGRLSPVTLLDTYLERIQRFDGQLAAFVHLADGAHAAAVEAEAEIRAGNWRGPLHGIPIAVKDNYTTADMPTTAGTGSEVGRASVITDLSDHTKKIIFHPKMLPAIVIEDPELTVGLPAPVTAATGMDALSHCLEAWCSPFYHPMAEGVAAEGMRLVRNWLPTAVKDGANVEARAHMLVASSMGATAFQKGLGAMHSLSHPCGANLNTHHGLTNAVVMPYVLAWNRRAIEDKMVRLAAYLGLQRQSFDGFLDWVLQLRADIGIPGTLADIGVREEHAAVFAPQALADPSTGGNPLAMTEDDYRRLYLNCIRGDLAR